MEFGVLPAPIAETRNAFYPSFSPPLQPQRLIGLPLGAVTPCGWLRCQLDLMADGMVGRLPEISESVSSRSSWRGGNGPGWEDQPYWLRGFYDLAVLTERQDLLAEAHAWIEAVLASAQPDGWFGPQALKRWQGRNRRRMVDLWPGLIMLDALISHFEASGDKRVIPVMSRFFRFCHDLPDDQFVPQETAEARESFGDWRPFVQYHRAGDALTRLHWLFVRTGEKWLLDLGARFYRHNKPPVGEWIDDHCVSFAQRFAYPAFYYVQSGLPAHLREAEYWYSQHMITWGQQPRGAFAADERIRSGCTDPRQAVETCAMVELARSFYLLGRITGDCIQADRAEDIMLNHFPAAVAPDFRGLHYLTASNQPQLDNGECHEYRNLGRMLPYSPHLYRCCRHNAAMGWPWYAKNLWQASPDNGLVAWLYGACEVQARVGDGTVVRVVEETNYPFQPDVRLSVHADSPCRFPLYLRVPGWAAGARLSVDGHVCDCEPRPGQYVRILRYWQPGDSVHLTLPARTSVRSWPRNSSVTVDRGPLSYSIRIGEDWRRCGGTEEWPEWEVLPTTPWNYGMALDDCSPENFRVVEKATSAEQPWTVENAPIEIHVPAQRIPGWTLENNTVQTLRHGPIRTDAPVEEITMIPLGCARLRMSCLPVIGSGRDARPWNAPASAPGVRSDWAE